MRNTTAMVLAAVLIAAAAPATEVTGRLRYNGHALGDLVGEGWVGHVVAVRAGGGVTVGNVDLASETYALTLEPGSYLLWLAVGPTLSAIARGPGWLAWKDDEPFEVSGSALERDLELWQGIHLTLPYDDGDGTWPGQAWVCPEGPPVEDRFTLAWDPVPEATSYRIVVTRRSCAVILERTTLETAATQVELEAGTLPEETHLQVTMEAHAGDTLVGRTFAAAMKGRMLAEFRSLHAPSTQPRFLGEPGRVIAQVARLEGAGGTVWQSDLELTNPGPEPVMAYLYYTPREADGLETYSWAQVWLDAGWAVRLEDLVGSAFWLDGTAGSLEVRGPVVASVRTHTAAPDGGTFGQGYGPFGAEEVASLDGEPRLAAAGVREGGGWRSNLALAEVRGEPVTVRVELRDGWGSLLGSREIDLPPFGNVQLNRVALAVGDRSSLDGGSVRVEVVSGTGAVGALLSVVDDATQDPTAIVLRHP